MKTVHSGAPTAPSPHHIYNLGRATISAALTSIINTSIKTATFPDSWKHAEVTALLKKPSADPKVLSNY
mgnify:CR=1 FL=1